MCVYIYIIIYIYIVCIYTGEHVKSDWPQKIPSMCAHRKGNKSLSLRPSDLLHHIINELTRYPVRCNSWTTRDFPLVQTAS